MKQSSWPRIVHSGDWCLRLALCTPSGALQKCTNEWLTVDKTWDIIHKLRQKSDNNPALVQDSHEKFRGPLEKCMTFKDIFPGLSNKTKVILHDFPGPGIFKKKIQDFPGGMGTVSTVTSTAQWPTDRRIGRHWCELWWGRSTPPQCNLERKCGHTKHRQHRPRQTGD